MTTPQPQPEAPWPTPNGITHTYPLHCHCGAVRYTITLSPPLYPEHTQGAERWTAIECNCSHCERVAAINVHPLTTDFALTQGKEALVEYRSGGRRNPHYICGACGCFLWTDLADIMGSMGLEARVAVNLRMLKDFDPEKIATKKDTVWRDMPPKYEV